ncbi:Hypothetical_protein [Hexamita inflata]|uniref:Hypothetical_protein n=1 Tax=Hexamita inflata TaxID=28002 RepID=A0ABP1H3R2_9EUKA
MCCNPGCCNNRYACVQTFYCFLFMSMLVAGIMMLLLDEGFEFAYCITMVIVGFFGFIITCCYSCITTTKDESQCLLQQVQYVPAQQQQQSIQSPMYRMQQSQSNSGLIPNQI